MKKSILNIELEFTPKVFWSLIPSININISSRELEFEWLCVGIYVGKGELEKKTEIIFKDDLKDDFSVTPLPDNVEKYLKNLFINTKAKETIVSESESKKTPFGVIPRHIYNEAKNLERIRVLEKGIKEYEKRGMRAPSDWYEELESITIYIQSNDKES